MDAVSECRPAAIALIARVMRRKKDDPDVEDCTNETFRRVLEHQDRIREGSAIKPWVLGIARHVALDALRAHYRQRARIQAPSPRDAVQGSSIVERVADPRSSPEEQTAHKQRAQHLAAILDELPEGQRDALVLFHVEQLSYREISDRLGIPVGTVGTWVLRARQAVASSLQREPNEKGVCA